MILTRPRRLLSLATAAVVLVGLLAPPLHHAAEERLTAHMLQHLGLMLIAAPLLAIGRPLVTAIEWLPRRLRRRVGRLLAGIPGRRIAGYPAVIWATHAAVLWAWHVPALYDRALADALLHSAEHATFLLSAAAFWSLLLYAPGRRRLGVGGALVYLFTMAMQSTILGALLVLADRPWYASHARFPSRSGPSPLEDQHVAGLIMWIPASVIYAVAMLGLVASWLSRRPTSADAVAERRAL
jgi:putative membrane protein